MRGEFKISEAALDVLKAGKFMEQPVRNMNPPEGGGWRFYLPPTQLDRKLYVEVNKVLETAGGSWDKKAKAHHFDSDPRPKLGLAVRTGVALDEKKLYQSFYTPPKLAARVVELAELRIGHVLLEPSAGEGALLDEATKTRADGSPMLGRVMRSDCLAVEMNPKAAEVLIAKGYEPMVQDFLKLDYVGGRPFDRVIMNPPFNAQEGIAHVTHALNFLAPSGILVSVLDPGFEFRADKKSKAFRALITQYRYDVEEVERGTFPDTDVSTRILKIWKVAP